MARTLREIYDLAKQTRSEYLELTEFSNDSKMSIMDAFTWVVATCIYIFEKLLDIFKIDLAKDLQNRINGTPSYYVNALLKYQKGDTLTISEDGTTFSYLNIDESKRIVKKVTYEEVKETNFYDSQLIFKIAGQKNNAFCQIEFEELTKIQSYLNQLLFAGQHATVVSRKGDILIPIVTVYYDGKVSAQEVRENIHKELKKYTEQLDFNSVVYAQRVIDAIQAAEHVVDVYIDESAATPQGIFLAQYDDDNHIIERGGVQMQQIERYVIPNSGFIVESIGNGVESSFPKWSESIILLIEDNEILY